MLELVMSLILLAARENANLPTDQCKRVEIIEGRSNEQQENAMAITVLDIPMGDNDADAKTIREYLKALLSTLWSEEEGFSGKQPFGNSGWKYDVYAALIKDGAVRGKLDADGYVADIDNVTADRLIRDAIASL